MPDGRHYAARVVADGRNVAPAESGRQTVVEVRGIAKLFPSRGGNVLALDGVDLDIHEGEFVSLLGPSGCGKSTLLRIVCGLIAPSRGSIAFLGSIVSRPSDDLGIVFQSPALLPWRTVIENVILPAEIKHLRMAECRNRAIELINLVGLSGFENHLPHELSGGMQQRVSLCRALVCDPPVILMDEPFGALDALTREQMNIELQTVWLERRKTVLFVTHSIPEAVFLSDRVIVMTQRPGTIKSTIEITFDRPRTLDLFQQPEFWEISRKLREDLKGQA